MSIQIKTANDVYQFVNRLKLKLQASQNVKLAKQLDDALQSGSSGLEVLGAIRKILIENGSLIETVIDLNEIDEINQVIAYINRAYGR
jgi:hypothetical protein